MAGINQAEFEKIFLDWYNPVRNSVFYKAGDMQTAEDITQDTFLKVWERREKIDKQTIAPLLYKISGNLFLNKTDHHRVRLKFASVNNEIQLSASPDFELEMKEFDKNLQISIAELDEKHRLVFLMNRIDDMTYVQIADNLGLSVKAVEKRMSRAIAFLKKRLNVKI